MKRGTMKDILLFSLLRSIPVVALAFTKLVKSLDKLILEKQNIFIIA